MCTCTSFNRAFLQSNPSSELSRLSIEMSSSCTNLEHHSNVQYLCYVHVYNLLNTCIHVVLTTPLHNKRYVICGHGISNPYTNHTFMITYTITQTSKYNRQTDTNTYSISSGKFCITTQQICNSITYLMRLWS